MNRLDQQLSNLESQLHTIPDTRKEVLKNLGNYLRQKKEAGSLPAINFICTHNSRRSQMAQLWLLAAAKHVNFGSVSTFSGGTEATAFHPNAVAAIQRAGFQLKKESEDQNPHYQLAWDGDTLEFWSKVFNESPNPTASFAAVMVCSDADEACPFVPGAERRISLPFEDPKRSDGTGNEEIVYDEACLLIGKEMLFAARIAVEAN